MKYKKIVSFICLTAIFSQNIPFDLLSYANEINKIEKMENIKEENDSNKEDKSSDTKVDTDKTTIKTEENKDTNVEEKKVSIGDYTFNAYIDGENELAFSLGFDTKEGKFIVKDRADKELSNKNPDSVIYKINVYDKENKEKIAIELTGKDKGISDKLDILNESKYETGDMIQIIPLNPKDGLKILGEVKGDIGIDKEDYSDGVDDYDYIHNVRFEITEEGLKSVYNEAPVIHGVDKADDKLNGLKVTDDHDGVIPNSQVQVTQDEGSITYTVSDSWGRVTSATKSKVETYSQSGGTSEETSQTLANNTITVKGIPFMVDGQEQDVRFKINFNTNNKTINLREQDAKIFATTNAEYFKFALHSSNGDIKHQVTLNGRDRSDSEKLKEINGITYEEGDYISIWHEESDKKLNIAGKVKGENTTDVTTPPGQESNGSNPGNSAPNTTPSEPDANGQGSDTTEPPTSGENTPEQPAQVEGRNVESQNNIGSTENQGTQPENSDKLDPEYTFTDGVPKNLINKRFRLTSTGLTLVTNNAPHIWGTEKSIEIKRGEEPDLLSGVTANDDLDGVLTDKIKVSELDITKEGEHQVEYSVTDSWGVETKVKRTVTITNKNDIDNFTIDVKKKNGEKFFTLGFDELKKELKITNKADSGSIDPDNAGDVFTLKVFNKNGKVKKTFKLKGTDDILSEIISKPYDNEVPDIEIPEEGTPDGESPESAPESAPEGSAKNSTQNNEGVDIDITPIDRFKYTEGDFISITVNDQINDINISGTIEPSKADIDNVNYVRFELKEGKVTAIYNEAPVINGAENKILNRGETFEPLNGVTVTDKEDTNIDKTKIYIKYPKGISEDNISKIKGSHTLIYKVKDSWGREATKERIITVDPKNNLEKNEIVLRANNVEKSDDNIMLKIGFDSINNKLVAQYVNRKLFVAGNGSDTAFRITVHRKNSNQNGNRNQSENQSENNSFELKKDVQLKSTDIDKINSISYSDGDTISVYAYDARNGVSITGGIVSSTGTYENGFLSNNLEPEDVMNNTRFKITSDGLDDDYNKAPEIMGLDEVEVVKGREFDKNKDVFVKDDKDTNLNFAVVGEFNKDNYGVYELTYTATDTLGRSTSKIRKVYVVPEYADTKIQLNLSDKSIDGPFTIGINRFGNKFTVSGLPSTEDTIPPEYNVPQNGSTPTTKEVTQGGENPQQEENTQPDTDNNNAVFRLKVFNKAGKQVAKVELLDITNDELRKLENLKKVTLGEGYTFSVWSKYHKKLVVKTNLEKEQINNNGFMSENYSDGIDNPDYMDNVRFTVSGEKLKALYNEAPTISIKTNSSETGSTTKRKSKRSTKNSTDNTLSKYSMYRGETPKYLDDIVISDDRDTDLGTDAVKVTIGEVDATKGNLENLEPNANNDGSTTSNNNDSPATKNATHQAPNANRNLYYNGDLKYTVTDSWGRTSVVYTRPITIKPGMDRFAFQMEGRDNGFEQYHDGLAMQFDEATMKLKFLHREPNKHFREGNPVSLKMYSLKVTNSDRIKFYKEFNGLNKVDGDHFNDLDDIQFEYGDIIEFYTNQGQKLHIAGEMHNTGNDYSDGISSGEQIIRTKFKVTKKGLEEIIEKDNIIEQNQAAISILTGFTGTKYVDVIIKPDTNSLEVILGTPTEPLEYRNRDRNQVKFEFYNQDGTEIEKFTLSGAHMNNENFKELFFKSNFNIGDYFTMNVLNPDNKKNFRILGITEEVGDVEDLTDGVDDVEKINHIRFVKTTTGLRAVYNEAPVISVPNEVESSEDGIDVEVNIPQGYESFNPLNIVVGSDDHDRSVKINANNHNNISTDNIGYSDITYTATDSWGGTTRKVVRFNIRPQIFFNKIKVYRDGQTMNTGDETSQPAFEIGMDNKTGKYTVKSYDEDVMTSSDDSKSIFKLWVVDKNNGVKKELDILGLDQANSSKFNELKNLSYADGDQIKVWRAFGEPLDTKQSQEGVQQPEGEQQIKTLKITGNIEHKREDYSNGIKDIDNMNNVAFKIKNGTVANDLLLESIYNNAPVFENLEDTKTIIKGDNFDAKDRLVVNDIEDTTIPNDKVQVEGVEDFNNNRVGEYPLTYKVTDSWGRTTQKQVIVKVLSKVVNNTFEVYRNSDQEQKQFTIGFDRDTGKIKVNKNSDEQFDSSNPEAIHSKIIVFDRYGENIKEITLRGSDTYDSSNLNELNNMDYITQQSIFIYHKDPSKVKITGNMFTPTRSYVNGFESEEEMIKTRFRITDDGLEAVKAGDAIFKGIDQPITITRGDEFDPLEGLTITHPTDEVNTENVKVKNLENRFKIGTQQITLEYTDSWGHKSTAQRTLIVKAVNELENNLIHIRNNQNGNRKAFYIFFDAINNKLIADIEGGSTDRLPNDMVVFALRLYSHDGELKNEVSVKVGESLGEFKRKVDAIEFEYGDYINVLPYSPRNGTRIYGTIEGQRTNYQTDNIDMDNFTNVRFELREDGFKSLYNQAPVFKGITLEKEIYKGDNIDFLEGLEITDDHDKSIDVGNITIKTGKFDPDKIGGYTVRYEVEDSWGRKEGYNRKIWVLSKVHKNKIIFHDTDNPNNEDNKRLFELGFDSKNNRFKLWRTRNKIFDSTKGDKTVLEITIYDANGTEEHKISFNGNESLNTDKLNYFNTTKYDYGKYIGIKVLEDSLNNNIKFKISGDITEDSFPSDKDPDYKNYIANVDYLDNVRFKITEFGLQAIYNSAPVITVPQETLEKFKSKDYKDYDLLEGVTITDDHDNLEVEDIDLNTKSRNSGNQGTGTDSGNTNSSTPESGNQGTESGGQGTGTNEDESNQNKHDEILNQKLDDLGEHLITYSITDSWGRPAEIKTRKLILNNALINNNIVIPIMDAGPKYTDGLQIKFNIDNKSISMENISDRNAKLSYHDKYLLLYTLEFLDENDKPKTDKMLFANEHKNEDGTLTPYYQNNVVTGFNALNLKFEYGDKIRLTTSQPGLKINGPTPNSAEDYSNGVQLGEVLNRTEFEISTAGLVAKEFEVKEKQNENSIMWLLGFNGNLGVKITTDRTTNTLKTEIDPSNEYVDTINYDPNWLLSIKLFSEDGTLKAESKPTGRVRVRDVATHFNEEEFNIGDYFELRLNHQQQPKAKKQNLRITGNVKYAREDYSDGIDDYDFIDNVRFKITDTGLEAVYNEAPRIIGADDTLLVKNRINGIGNVTVEDDHDNPKDIRIEPVGDVDEAQIGAYMLSYRATDSWGRSSESDRFVVVQAPPVIKEHDNKKIVEMGSVTTDQVDDYLKTKVVTITDEEDNRDNKPLDIDVARTFNPDQVGTYPISYTVTDSDGHETTASFNIEVVKTINVDVPIKIPFQVVTNLKDKKANPFISGVMKVNNNNIHSTVDVTVKSFNKVEDSGELDIVHPDSVDWTRLTKEETMTKLALGMYNKEGFTDSNLTKDDPLWFSNNMTNSTSVGQLPKATNLRTPANAKLGFVSKHGRNFMGGNIRGKFNLVLEFR